MGEDKCASVLSGPTGFLYHLVRQAATQEAVRSVAERRDTLGGVCGVQDHACIAQLRKCSETDQ
eukprot:15444094-Alexandrium_andersonii.AAC.1